jgi:hypothetical protein
LDFMPSWRNANSITPKWNSFKYIVFRNGICMDLHKVQKFVDWVTIAFVHDD